jgi:hypothetical protein
VSKRSDDFIRRALDPQNPLNHEEGERLWRAGYRHTHPGVSDAQINNYIKEQERLGRMFERQRRSR